jgi:hypothetical protein
MLVELLLVERRELLQLVPEALIFLNDASVNFIGVYFDSEAIVPKSLDCFIRKEAPEVGKAWSRPENFIHFLHELLVNGYPIFGSDFFILLSVKNEFKEYLFMFVKDVAWDLITHLIASIFGEELLHRSSKRVRFPVIISLAIGIFKVLFKLFSEVSDQLLHVRVCPKWALSIKVLHDFKRCLMGFHGVRGLLSF